MFCKTNIYSVGLVANKNANSNSERVHINVIFKFDSVEPTTKRINLI